MSAATGANPQLPEDVTTRLFRLLDRRLRGDQILGAYVKTWQTWRGETTDKAQPGKGALPYLQLYPAPSSEVWFSPERQLGTLTVQLEAGIATACVDDCLNLWAAVRNAIYPKGDVTSRQDFINALKSAGAWKGLWEMSQPSVDRDPSAGGDGLFILSGAVRIQYLAPAAS